MSYKNIFFLLFINKTLKMEKQVIKTIREAFKIAYINKLIKEAASDLALKLTQPEVEEVNRIYPKWINREKGYRDYQWGKAGGLSPDAQSYLIEKAIEDYKGSRSKLAHDAIALFYYPFANSLTYNTITQQQGSKILDALGGADKKGHLQTVLPVAWDYSLGDPSVFDVYIDEYVENKKNGIGPYLVNKLALQALDYSKSLGAVRRGGGAGYEHIDQYETGPEGERKFDLPGGIDVDAEASAQGSESQLETLYDTFKQAKEEIMQDDSIKNPFLKLVLLNYLDGKKAFETVAENPEIVDQIVARKAEAKGGNVDAALKQVKNEANSYPINYFKPGVGKYYVLLEKIGIENGLPSDWLENIYSEGKFIEIAKFISSRKGVSNAPDYKEPKQSKYAGLVFEKFINSNMDAIIQEVYKRLNESYFHDEEEAYIGRTDAYYADEYDGDVYEPEYWTYSTDINDKDFAEGGDLYQLTDEGKEIINSWLDSKEHNEYQRMNAKRSGGLSSFANMDREELWDYLTQNGRYSKQI